MGAISSFVLGGVAERLVPAIHTPVEDIIYEVLDQKGLPTRSEVRDLRNKLERLEKTIADLTSTLEGLRDEVAAAAAAATSKAAASDNGAVAPSGRRPVGRPPIGPRDCKLHDCDSAVRAKGFCGKHYQKWKRGTLDGYVNFDGTTVHGEVRYKVADEHLGELVETTYEGDEVIFLLPESGGVTIRHKVNDARIDA
ncbi:MAG TPA: hypothetical protein DIU15_19270 [Deltaproteobacteria bacterium]|nr:hypothetical protein [Deltaproteobacteria bacterium]HCP48188.1 hypothetical protein [Deltaproteobacteria bacterium]